MSTDSNPSQESLKERLSADLKTSMKAGEKLRFSTLRLLSAAVKNREVELLHELSDDEFREIAARESKRRGEAIAAYESAGREDLASREREEREILSAYLPPQLSEAEIDALVDEALASTGASAPGHLGKVMGFVMSRAKGRVDGAAVQARVRERLGG
ncbi:MAG: GatB/YqeY domain-containing protein [Actinomycetota bacterium]|nr:GatB/YqeY domain-containing protein [Actinomycetota bacterium]